MSSTLYIALPVVVIVAAVVMLALALRLKDGRRTAAFAGAAALLVLGGVVLWLTPASPTPAQQAATDAALAPQPALPPGTTLHYTRSNQDGDLPERVLVHVVSPTELAVAKMVEPCTDAALVTARFDPRTGEVIRLVGGRLQRDATQSPQAFIDFDPQARRLDVRLGDEKSEPVETPAAPPSPWRMYDFDLAEFALYGPRTPDAFSFGLAMAWPDGSSPVVRILGQADAELLDSGVRTGQPFNLFAVGGEAFGGPDGDGGGLLMLNAEYGYVIEARFGAPNHTGYDDFLLRLESMTPAFDIDTGEATGEDLWREELLAHWRNCPA